MTKIYEIRDPVHGFIRHNEWERDLINHPSFQRLRRIRQLAWTEMVYPGATHTRFGHSLGVMEVATRLYDGIVTRYSNLLTQELGFTLDALSGRQRQLVRLAALFHDIGHGPFSHAAEDLMPTKEDGTGCYTHEDYSIAVIKHTMSDVIDSHPYNRQNFGIKVQDVVDFFKDTPENENLIWRELISSQLDADRMDYMLRDSHHAGVAYGHYDLGRILATIALVELPDQTGYTVGLDEDGVHAAEGLLIARYMLFTQVYFHKTRIIYDYHLKNTLAKLLHETEGKFPTPVNKTKVEEYLSWDDWRVYGALNRSEGGEHGAILSSRSHYRLLRETTEVPSLEALESMDKIEVALEKKDVPFARLSAGKSWYKMDSNKEIYIQQAGTSLGAKTLLLSELSSAIRGLSTVRQNRIYVPQIFRKQAEALIENC